MQYTVFRHLNMFMSVRLQPIMLNILPIILLSNAQKSSPFMLNIMLMIMLLATCCLITVFAILLTALLE